MGQKRISVTISPDGDVETEVQGMKGTGCDALLAALAQELGETVEHERKLEFYEVEVGTETHLINGTGGGFDGF